MQSIAHWQIADIPSQQGRTVLITGANSGIGFEAAKVLARKGAKVVLACRSAERGQAAMTEIRQSIPDASVELMLLDLASLRSVEEFAQAFSAAHSRLDILINNAGIMAPPYQTTADGFESQFGTNHLGHFALTGKLLPLLEATPGSRIVVVSSVAHRFGWIDFKNLNAEKYYFRWTAYAQSKLANLMFARELHRRLRKAQSKVCVVAVHPGYSDTNLQRHTPGSLVMNKLAQSQDKGCLPTLFAATSRDINGGEYIGPDGWLELKGKPGKALVAGRANNPSALAKLWSTSEKLTKVSYLSVA